ncbi:hypothetical protein ACS5PU_23800 [Pedobacter sp. GSP4]
MKAGLFIPRYIEQLYPQVAIAKTANVMQSFVIGAHRTRSLTFIILLASA